MATATDQPAIVRRQVDPAPDLLLKGALLRRVCITKRDIEKHHPTDGCAGCKAILKSGRGTMHTEERRKLEEALAYDPASSVRMNKSKERFDEPSRSIVRTRRGR